MYKISQKHWLRALGKTIIVFAAIHVVNMAFYATVRGDWQIFNGFRILGFNLYLPGIDVGGLSLILSWVLLLAIYTVVYILK